MKEITTVWIQINKEAYRANEKNGLYEKEYREKYIYQTLHLIKKRQFDIHLNFL